MDKNSVNESYQNKTYLVLLEKLGPDQSLILIEKLVIDLRNTRRGLHAAQSAKAIDLLGEPSHVLISLAGVIGAIKLHKYAKQINEFKDVGDSYFPSNMVLSAIFELDLWLQFLKSDKVMREAAL